MRINRLVIPHRLSRSSLIFCPPSRLSSTYLPGRLRFWQLWHLWILKRWISFSKALIPYNTRNESALKEVGYNEYGYPTCPNDNSLVMKHLGVTKEAGHFDRIKWGCPKMQYSKGQWHWLCKIHAARPGKDALPIPAKTCVSVGSRMLRPFLMNLRINNHRGSCRCSEQNSWQWCKYKAWQPQIFYSCNYQILNCRVVYDACQAACTN